MGPVIYTAQYKPSRWSHVPVLLLGYGTGLVACMLIRFFAENKSPHPGPFLGALLFIVIIRIIFPENRNQLYELMINEYTRGIGIHYYNPYEGFKKITVPFEQLQIRFLHRFWKDEVRGIDISIKKGQRFVLQKGKRQFSKTTLTEAKAQLYLITHVVGMSNQGNS